MFIVEKGRATSTEKIKTTLTQTLTTLDGDNTQTSHRTIRINMLQHPAEKTGMFNHLDSTSKIKGKEPIVMINSVLLTL